MKRGLNLLEISLALVLVISAIIGSVALFGGTKENQETAALQKNLTSMTSDIINFFEQDKTFGAYGQSLNEIVLTAGLVPSSMRGGDGSSIVMPGSTEEIDIIAFDKSFAVRMNGISDEACIKLSSIEGKGAGQRPVSPSGRNINAIFRSTSTNEEANLFNRDFFNEPEYAAIDALLIYNIANENSSFSSSPTLSSFGVRFANGGVTKDKALTNCKVNGADQLSLFYTFDGNFLFK